MPRKPSTRRDAPFRSHNRLPAHLRGYDSRWAQASRDYRKANPLCVVCQAFGWGVPSKAVDHIIPHKMDQRLLWDPRNWQALCHSCHHVKTEREKKCGHVDWTVNEDITVVSGPPRTGKSTYVEARKQDGDIVWDMDLEAEKMGWPRHQYPRPPWHVYRLKKKRDAVIDALAASPSRAWIIVASRTHAFSVALRLRARLVEAPKRTRTRHDEDMA